jgi:dehydrogenase/reductase SDR family member 1
VSAELKSCVCVVTGATRGVGKGIALGLGEAGATVIVTGRTTERGSAHPLGGSVEEVARMVERAGGKAEPLVMDAGNDDDVQRLFAHVDRAYGALDLLVNNAFAIPSDLKFGAKFWEVPIAEWDTFHRVGLRNHYVHAVHAAQRMVQAKRGLIVNVSSPGAQHYAVSVAYGAGKAALDRMSRDMAIELKKHTVFAVSLWPGVVRTERLAAMGDANPWAGEKTESALFSGRAVAALLTASRTAPDAFREKTGKALSVADLAKEFNFADEM